ncbi:MAG: hypothetical protein QXL10_05535 [Candidatus Bathyarchaeia archaeon]
MVNIGKFTNMISKEGVSRLLPYIKAANRKKYEKILEELVKILKTLPPEEIDGELNYVVTKILKEIYPLRYFHINKAVGVLECIKLEYYRRVAAPYEDQKIKETGDI